MNTWIALLRGINIGGNHLLPMAQLKQLLARHDCHDVQTYIQSGNVVFRSPETDAAALESRLTAAIAAAHGFAPRTLILARDELTAAVASNPFPEAAQAPKTVHLFFLTAPPPTPNTAALDALRTTDRYALHHRYFYLHTPDGFGSSKLAERAERHLGVPATARNWNTVTKLVDMLGAYPDHQ